MATVAEKTADVATLLDDIANTLSGQTKWSDADTSVVNDGSTDHPNANGRVLSNSDTGTYLYMYISHGDGFESGDGGGNMVGIRFVHSTDWDATHERPAGLTTVVQDRDYVFGNDIADESPSTGAEQSIMYRRVSFPEHHYGRNFKENQTPESELDDWNRVGRHGRGAMGIWVKDGNNPATRTDARTLEVTYFLAGRDDGLQVAAWNSNDGTNGIASWFTFEYVDNKWWEDHTIPVMMMAGDSRQDSTSQYNVINAYGFKNWAMGNQTPHGVPGCVRGCISRGAWGTLNPDASDDTFFFKRSAIHAQSPIVDHQTGDNQYRQEPVIPVALVHSVIPNHPGEGVAHGDNITADSTTYKAMVQSGAGKTNPIGIAVRFE